MHLSNFSNQLYIVATPSKEVSGYSIGTVVYITLEIYNLEVMKANVSSFSNGSLLSLLCF